MTDRLADSAFRRRDAYPHWVQERVRFSDTDMVGHANNLAFAAFFETGRSMLLQRFMDRGAGPEALLLLAEIRMKYLGEMHWPASIDVGTAVQEIGARSCFLVQGLFDGERCVGLSESALVLIDAQTRRARVIPDDVRAILETSMRGRGRAPRP